MTFGLARQEDDVADAGVVADEQHARPGRAAVSGLVQAAVAAGGPKRSLRRHVDGGGIARVDDDLPDVLRLLEPDALPAFAGVGRLVQPVAEVRAALARILTRAEPHHVGILRIDDDAAKRERAALVEDRREGNPAVLGLPQAAKRTGDIPDVRVLRIDFDILHAAGREPGADASDLDSLERVRGQAPATLAGNRHAHGSRQHGRYEQHPSCHMRYSAKSGPGCASPKRIQLSEDRLIIPAGQRLLSSSS